MGIVQVNLTVVALMMDLALTTSRDLRVYR